MKDDDSVLVAVRMSRAVKAELDAAAERKSVALSTWIRMVCLEEAQRPAPTKKKRR